MPPNTSKRAKACQDSFLFKFDLQNLAIGKIWFFETIASDKFKNLDLFIF